MKSTSAFFSIVFTLASTTSALAAPASYRALTAVEKQAIIMEQVKGSAYPATELPIKGLGFKEATHLVCARFLSKSFTGDIRNPSDNSDILPADRAGRKVVHPYGSVASVNFVVTNLNHPFSGMFRYDTVGLVRLAPALHSSKTLIPGLAMKIFFDGQDSVNFHAIYSLEGQPGEHNYFANPLKSRIGAPNGTPEKIINFFFQKSLKRVPKGPYSSLALPLDEAALRVQNVSELNQIEIPTMMEYRPTAAVQKIYEDALKTPMTPDGYRQRFAELPEGMVLYKVFATAQDGVVYEIGKIEMTSKFFASLYGDQVLFFKHQVRAAAQE